ncbi:IS200/IS605 family accessory protein TnpB-related protein [Roseinatronobacter thiooxidans]|nr:IS200/IS605 family accessory protein TnpB-related protein [Roseinatronobacter thiooxidans]
MTYANINVKVAENETPAFKEWCVHQRLPDALRDEGAGRHLEITGVEFPEFGRDAIHKALQVHAAKGKGPEARKGRVAIAYRFVRDEGWPRGNPLSAWRLFITLEVPGTEIQQPVFAAWGKGRNALMAQGVAGNFCGALGVDLNADHLAWAVIDRHGNLVKAKTGRIDLPLRGKTSGQRAALIGDASAAIVSMAAELDLPIVIESLDFAAGKRELEGSGAGYARMLSSLAYAAIQTMLRRRAARAGVELVEVNPAYTSVIGHVNYARRYGLSVHCAAAVATARRAAGLSERVNYVHGSRGRRNTLPTQSECRRHVWRQWARVRKGLLTCDSQNKGRHTAGAGKTDRIS